MADANQKPEKVPFLKYWHIILIMALQLIAVGVAYGKLNEGMDDLKRRMSAMENGRFVPREEFDSWREDVRDSLHRIEAEILERNNAEKALR